MFQAISLPFLPMTTRLTVTSSLPNPLVPLQVYCPESSFWTLAILRDFLDVPKRSQE